MGGIDEFLGKKRNKIKEFEQLSKDKTQKEKRELEVKLLKPEKIPKYTGKKSFGLGIKKHSVKLVFSGDKDFEKFKRHFKVLENPEKSVSNLSLLLLFLDKLNNGEFKYNKGDNELITTSRDNKRVATMGDRK
ncbi:MAG: hypothetical protein ACXAC7_23525 [Candidatus Hodarchaeales archaeon]|jgi:hypothetical protein